MQELSDQLDQVEKQLESSTHVASSQPTQMISLPGYTWGEHHASHGRRQYHGQGNMWINYAMNSHIDGRVVTQRAALPTTHLLPGPVSVPVPQYNYNVPGVNSATGWMWDTSEGVLISDVGGVPGLGTAIYRWKRRRAYSECVQGWPI